MVEDNNNYVPITKYKSDNKEKIEVIIDELKNNVPSNFYIMSPAIGDSRDVHDYRLDDLNAEYEKLKQYENKLVNDQVYNELINNSTFMNY